MHLLFNCFQGAVLGGGSPPFQARQMLSKGIIKVAATMNAFAVINGNHKIENRHH